MALPIGLTQEQIKEINRVNVINTIKDKGETTKLEIAKLLGISLPTVTTNVNSLMEEGIIEPAGTAESTGGRKPLVLKFVPEARFSFGVEITPEKIKIALLNLDAEVIDRISFHYAVSDTVSDSFKGLLSSVRDRIVELTEKHNIQSDKVLGVGIALPGLVDEENKVLENAPNIGIRDFAFDSFEKELGWPVFIENEANVGAFAEIVAGYAKGNDNVVYISVTEGIGTGIMINGRIYKSHHKKAGEFGHMRVSNEALTCNCGRTGCWELYASKKAMLRYVKEATGLSMSSFEEVFSALGEEIPHIDEAIEKYMVHLFIGIENIILGLNPECVIIGGELGAYEKELLAYAGSTGRMKSSFMAYEGTRISFSSLKGDGPLVGAALLPLETIFNYTGNTI